MLIMCAHIYARTIDTPQMKREEKRKSKEDRLLALAKADETSVAHQTSARDEASGKLDDNSSGALVQARPVRLVLYIRSIQPSNRKYG